jgi:hypothetical protein
MRFGDDDAFDGRHDDGYRPSHPDGSQQPGTPDPQPGPAGNDAADQRH